MSEILVPILGVVIRGLVSTIGVRAATAMLDETRKAMVAGNRGPTDAELDTLFNDIQARSDRIQGA